MAEKKTIKKSTTRRSKAEMDVLKAFAHDLYVNQGVTDQQHLADRVKVSITSINLWINADNGAWKKEKAVNIISKAGEIRRMENKITFYNDLLDEYEKSFKSTKDEGKKSGYINMIAKINDAISKAGAAIKSLESDVDLGARKAAMIEFLNELRKQDYELSIKVAPYADAHLQSFFK